MAAVTICSDFGAQEEEICHYFHFYPFIYQHAYIYVYIYIFKIFYLAFLPALKEILY